MLQVVETGGRRSQRQRKSVLSTLKFGERPWFLGLGCSGWEVWFVWRLKIGLLTGVVVAGGLRSQRQRKSVLPTLRTGAQHW